jgi:hypothetical protein
MPLLSASPTPLHPADAKLIRISLIYVLPSLALFYIVFAGLLRAPDSLAGMYGNFDGHWASWNTRGILEWSAFLDFSPFSPLVGTGSVFAPNLPWLNPAALALGISASLPVRHLVSMLIYLTELSASLYLLYRHLEFSREQSLFATMLYTCIFFIPFSEVTRSLPWFALAPVNAHLIAAMNVATIALIRVGYEELPRRLLFGFLFVAALFVAFASAPVTSVTYVPVYAVLWLAVLIPFRGGRRIVLWRWSAIAFALLVLALIGVPRYLAATVMTSARADAAPPILHPGWRLLSPTYWQDLAASLPLCLDHMQLMCASSVIGWFEIAVLAGAIGLAFTASGVKRRYGLVIIVLLASIHFYALLSLQQVLGRLHTVSTPYLMWAFFPLAPPAAVAAGGTVAGWLVGRRAASSGWMLVAASCLIAVVATLVWVRKIEPSQPRLPGRGPLGLAPITHVPTNNGPIVAHLQQHIGLRPDSEFRGYAATFLGAPDGLVRELTGVPNDRMTYEAYIAARGILFAHFGNSFQMMDLWNNDIPTLEEYGQWVSKQLYFSDRDLLAQPQDEVDPLRSTILVYRFRPLLLRALGVRFVIADGTLTHPLSELVVTESGRGGAKVKLYEIKGANLGQFSPTQVIRVADYATAVAALREQRDFENRVVLSSARSDLVRASRSQLVAIKDGYRLTAAAAGSALVVLPIQFSNCWEIETSSGRSAHIVRANIVQTGVVFKNEVDARLRFNFEPWNASCRFQDARDLSQLELK